MATSRISAALIVLCVSPLGGHCEDSPTYGDGWFMINDRKFNHVWSTKTSMPSKRSDMTATTVGDAIYLVGGCALDQEWVGDGPYPSYVCGGKSGNAITALTIAYLPKTDTFDTKFPDAPRPRYRHAAASVDNLLYLFGGVDGSDNIIQEVDVLDTTSRKWSTLTQKMPGATTDLSAFAWAGRVYTTGGYTAEWQAVTTTQIFDPKLEDGKSWQVGPSLKAGRGDAFAAVANGKALVGGGFTHENNWKMPLASMEMLSLDQSNAFESVKDMEIARGDKAVAVLNGVLHVVGGETKDKAGHSAPLVDVEVYDPDSKVWAKGGDIPSHRFRFVAAAHGDSLFIFGGQGYLEPEGDYEKDGSKYPVMDTVEAYTETLTVQQINKVSSLLPIVPLFVMLAGALIQN